ncbi:MAG: VWA domain-containing protein [Planctomycetes bacterium]|nr:VWA domain-containing protein [Planctomycetota bacterium]
MEFAYPLALLLSIPAAIVAWRLWAGSGEGKEILALRLAALLAVVFALAGPSRVRSGNEVDVVFVVDRSRSMPEGSDERALELVSHAEGARLPGCRLGVVAFGRDVALEQVPTEAGRFPGFEKSLDRDASSLADAIRTALAVAEPGRALRVVLLTDGRPTGASPLYAVPEALERRTPIDYRLLARPADDRVGIVRLDVPGEIEEGGPVLVSAWVRTDGEGRHPYRLWRDGGVIQEGELDLRLGTSRLAFRDRLPPGAAIHDYELEIDAGEDATPENNRARGVVRAVAPARILHVRAPDGPGHLGEALAGGSSPVDQLPPGRFPAGLDGLDPYRLVVLENVAVEEIGAKRLGLLRAYVERMGGGLLVTGGRRSFGLGGYHKSELDPVLPVSMEMRSQQRKLSMALVLVLDRSGSMAVGVGPGLTKMDLANRGAVAAIDLLSEADEVAVIAVDSTPHLIQPLAPVEDKGEIAERVLSIESMGGGIFVYAGLAAAGDVIADASASTRHVVLFADAADAEEPGDYQALLEKFAEAGITVSVIGLGKSTDQDGAFLEDVAKRGGGRIFFTEEAKDLPRLFSQDTITVSQATFAKEETPGRWLADVHLLGEVPAGPFPAVGGFNVTWPRAGASLAAATDDEDASPLAAFWHRGAGRVGAFTPEADGEFSGGLLGWDGYAPFFRTWARWLAGQEEPAGVSLTLSSEESEARLVLEIDRADPATAALLSEEPALLVFRADDPAREPLEVPLVRVGEEIFEARFPLAREGTYLPLARLGGNRVVKAPPVALPYSPEFAPATPGGEDQGHELLERLAEATGGAERLAMDDLFESWGEETRTRRSLVPSLALAALLLFFVEIAFRRLQLAQFLPRILARTFARIPLWSRIAARLRLPRIAREVPADVLPPAPAPDSAPRPRAPAPPKGEGLSAALSKARRRLGGRLRGSDGPPGGES